ncbi:MAG TPA: hypothetical protein VGL56_20935 [Fimbriimonadaceae bacterium]|jgi:hypothetical protein
MAVSSAHQHESFYTQLVNLYSSTNSLDVQDLIRVLDEETVDLIDISDFVCTREIEPVRMTMKRDVAKLFVDGVDFSKISPFGVFASAATQILDAALSRRRSFHVPVPDLLEPGKLSEQKIAIRSNWAGSQFIIQVG